MGLPHAPVSPWQTAAVRRTPSCTQGGFAPPHAVPTARAEFRREKCWAVLLCGASQSTTKAQTWPRHCLWIKKCFSA